MLCSIRPLTGLASLLPDCILHITYPVLSVFCFILIYSLNFSVDVMYWSGYPSVFDHVLHITYRVILGLKHNCAQSYAHWCDQFLQMNCFRFRFCMCMCFVFYYGASLSVLGLVILCLVYFLWVIVWLSVPVQSIAWKDSSLEWPIVCPGGC